MTNMVGKHQPHIHEHLLPALLFLTLTIQSTHSTVHVPKHISDTNLADGNRAPHVFRLDRVTQHELDHPLYEPMRRFRRQVGASHPDPKQTHYAFRDGHYVAEVHWSGSNSSAIMILMKDPSSMMTRDRPSHFFVSTNYGQTFVNRTGEFALENSTLAVLSDFFASKANKDKYVLVAKYHRVVFFSIDECRTFTKVDVSFYPNSVKYHPQYTHYLLAHEDKMGEQRLFVSTNNGQSWRYKSEHVKSYYWGYAEGYDRSSNIYYHRDSVFSNRSRTRTSELRLSTPWRSWYTRFYGPVVLVSDIVDFVIQNQYIFVTMNKTSGNGINTKSLHVSINRGDFKKALFPSSADNATSYMLADASENETLMAIGHRKGADLYISGPNGHRYTKALSGIVYYSEDDGKKAVRGTPPHDYVDLHRVKGISGIYIATNVTKGAYRSWITYDKGGSWQLLRAPSAEQHNCSHLADCSLHLSQEYGYHDPYRRFSPLYSRESAPGFILGTGNTGPSLSGTPSLYFTRDAGVTWKKIFTGNFWYSFVDHGGVIVVLQKYGLVNKLHYSWDEGNSWTPYKFTAKKMRVYGLKTEPGEKTTIFTIFGSYAGAHSWVLIQVDVRPVLGASCTRGQYKPWQAVDTRNDTFYCILGMKRTYQRRAPNARCYNGYSYDRVVSLDSCDCAHEDYMCDYGFKEFEMTWWQTICIHDNNFEDYSRKQPSWCKPGLMYNISSGYRKVPGDMCHGGAVEKRNAPTPKACSVPTLENFIIYAKRKAIYRLEVDTQGNKKGEPIEFQLNGLRNTIALEMDYKNNILFYADVSEDVIMKLELTSGNLTELKKFNESRTYVEALAYDWVTDNLFFTDAGSAEIGIINVNGRHKKRLLGPDVLGKPRALAVHPVKGLMFWTDWGDKPMIARANMDGTSVKPVITVHVQTPNGLTIDYEKNTLYWADASMNRIEHSNLDGSNRKVLTSAVEHPYAITLFRSYVFWDDTYKQAISKASKLDGNNKVDIVRWNYQLKDIKAFWPDRQKTDASNQCTNHHPCKYICLPTSATPGYNCTCPDNLVPSSDSMIQCKCPNDEQLINNECKPKPGGQCSSSQWKCADGGCIHKSWKCDGEADCTDGSDEWECDKPTCATNEFQCATTGRCILSNWRCDGERDCTDGSDEVACTNSTCRHDYFKCSNGRCIRASWKCDGDNDCGDGADEQGCATTPPPPQPTQPHRKCTNNEFKCHSDGSCIPKWYVCDMRADCPRGEDELGCATRPPLPPTPPIHCDHDQAYCHDHSGCYMKEARCDGAEDCFDGSDEQGCKVTPEKCDSKTQFQCPTTRKCIPLDWKCNGKKDCWDGADEKDCHRPPGPTCYPPPFGFNCTIDGTCLKQDQLCNGQQDCRDRSDENHRSCGVTNRVGNLKHVLSRSGTFAMLLWEHPENVTMRNAGGYIVAVYDERDRSVTKNKLKGLATFYNVTGLKKCHRYHFAVALKNNRVKKDEDNLFSFTERIVLEKEPRDPHDVKIEPVIGGDILRWVEDDVESECFQNYVVADRKLICNHGRPPVDIQGPTEDVVHIDRILRKHLNTTFKCQIQINYVYQSKKKPKMLLKFSPAFYYPLTSPDHGKQHGRKKKGSTLIWAIPVALVLSACVFGLVLMVYKYRRLQLSFLNFAARSNYTRTENDFDDDDDDNMIVGFRSGEEAPMINRFSDDDPLVVG